VSKLQQFKTVETAKRARRACQWERVAIADHVLRMQPKLATLRSGLLQTVINYAGSGDPRTAEGPRTAGVRGRNAHATQ
jgi:hypothetical protein